MNQTIQFKISLTGSQPSIWRSFQVSDDYRLDHFHQVIQIVMGWQNSHLHEFRHHETRYGMHMPQIMDDFDEGEDETQHYLRELKLKEGTLLHYLYDFGDSWEHELQVEKISSEKIAAPLCLAGQRSCPIEDSGGIWGYMDMVEVVKNPKHPEYEEWEHWLPEDFDPEVFSLEAVNKELYRFSLWRKDNPKAKSSPWHLV